jgi:AcrR family transcriptional regulator
VGTKDDIYEAALEVFAAKGYSAASLDMIAAKVGIKKPSLYNHYKNKEAILEVIYARLAQAVRPREASGLPAWESAELAFEEIIRGYISLWERPEMERAWTIVSEEQYVDPRAAAIILGMTESYLAKTLALFEALRESGLLVFEGEARGRAEDFAYALRAMHLEYGLRRLHGLDTKDIVARMLALAPRTAARR